jgi:pSer/pThr/pTyr-binding forkhead associated (FHA) protein
MSLCPSAPKIRPDGDRFVLTDTGSLNGAYVNQQPIDTIVPSDGDIITIGIFWLLFSAENRSSPSRDGPRWSGNHPTLGQRPLVVTRHAASSW